MTRLAVISDIHGNYKALEAFLSYLEEHPVQAVIGLGDYVTDGPYPERTMDMLYELQKQVPCYLVRGNREEYLLENAENSQGWKPSSQTGALYYTAKHLRERDLKFFRTLSGERRVKLKDCPPLYICHGIPGEIRGNVTLGEGVRERALKASPCPYLLGGHSHCQEIFQHGEKTYLNPGSLGLAIDGVGKRAQFALMTFRGETRRPETELLSLSYDVEGFLQDFTESGLDEWGMVLNRAVKKTLVTGRNYFYESVLEAARESGLPLSQVPESVWEQVASRLEL